MAVAVVVGEENDNEYKCVRGVVRGVVRVRGDGWVDKRESDGRMRRACGLRRVSWRPAVRRRCDAENVVQTRLGCDDHLGVE